MTIMIQAKDDLYHNGFPMNIFLPLAVEVSERLH
jgi:hypothetical protein